MWTEGRQEILEEPVRIALLGASAIAPLAIIAPARSRRDVSIVAVGARDPARAMSFIRAHGLDAEPCSYAEALASKADLVYLALPPSQHAKWAIEAMRAGKGVLCEKPFARSAAEAEAMVAVALETGLPLLEALHYRFHPAFERVRALVTDGAIGRVVRADIVMSSSASASTHAGFRWRGDLGGGVLLDLGCYAVHALRTLFGSEPDVVDAKAVVQGDVDVSFRASLRFEGGPDATLDLSMIADDFAQHLRLTGTSGSIEMPWFAMPQSGDSIAIEAAGSWRREDVGPGTSFDHQLAHVVSVVRDQAVALTGGDDAIANMRLLDRLRERAGLESVLAIKLSR